MLEPLTFAVFCALMLWLAAAITLRMIAQRVRLFASEAGSPAMSRTVRRSGWLLVILTAPSLLVVGMTALSVTQPDEVVLFVVFLGLMIHLAAVGGFLIRWAEALRHPEENSCTVGFDIYLLLAVDAPLILLISPINTALRGAAMAYACSWWMLLAGFPVSIAYAAASQGRGTIVASAWLAMLLLAVLFELVAGYFNRLHRQHLLLWQIYLAITSRRPLVDEVEFLAQHGDPLQRRRFTAMTEELREGVEPEEVFAHTTMLSNLEGAYIDSGLRAGQLPDVLREILKCRTQFAERLQQAQFPMLAVFYLWYVVLKLNVIVGFLSYWIIPKFARIFDDFGTELPTITKAMIRSADNYASYWFVVIPALIVGMSFLTVLTLFPFAGGMARLREMLTWIWPRICLPDVLRTLAVTVRAKLPMEEAFIPLVRRQLSVPLHNRLVRFQEIVRDGNDCWIGMAAERYLTLVESQFLRSAQKAGNLPWALETLSTRFEQRWRFWLMFVFEFLQPALVIAVGLVVCFVSIAYFLPLVKLINDLA